MSAYQVLEADIAKKLPAKDDRPELAIHRYVLGLNGDKVEAERVAKLDTPLPSVGSVIEGTIERTNFGPRFKPERSGGFRGGRSPSESRRIERQHAQHMALQYVAIKAQLGKVQDFDFADLVKLADAFDRDLDPEAKPSDVPANTEGLPPARDLENDPGPEF